MLGETQNISAKVQRALRRNPVAIIISVILMLAFSPNGAIRLIILSQASFMVATGQVLLIVFTISKLTRLAAVITLATLSVGPMGFVPVFSS